MERKRVLGMRVTFTILVSVCLLMFFQGSALAGKYGGILKVGIKWDARKYLDPHSQKGYLVIWTTQQMYNYLARERNDGTIEPRLAESWRSEDGGRVWIFNLRKGVKFHDGTDWDAVAFKWNVDRMMAPETKCYMKAFRLWVDRVEVVDKYTAKVTLKRPGYLIASFLGGIFKPKFISPAVVKRYGKDWVNHPAGTGPFMFDRMDPDGTTYLKRNPNYWEKGLPYLDGVVFKMYRDPQARHNAIRAGEIDMEMSASFEHYLISKSDPNLVVSVAPATPYGLNLGANVTMAPWNDIRVRKAILGYALDRKKVCRTVYHGLVGPKVNPCSSAHYYYEDLNDRYPFDLEKAKALLQEAGMIGKTVILTVNNTTSSYASIGTILKSDLAKIGVNMKIEKMEYITWIRRFYIAHKVPFSTPLSYFNDPAGWVQYVGPTAPMNPTQAGVWLDKEKKVNQDPALLKILAAAGKAIKDPERKNAFQALFRHLVDKAYYAGVTSPPIYHNFRPGVKGYRWRLLNLILDTVYME
ncbi:MAG: ABC transporter substrate-binding protein [Deltaproteobacteria bacterium]|nr:ABC transporter substrate-binding protein [Deltaproteobacteria bacterium]